MYVPDAFRISDLELLHEFIAFHGFAMLVSNSENGPLATHVPLFIDRAAGAHGTLVGHMARANPHWRLFATPEPALAIFHGPHAYISPSWYESKLAVPTWNYTAVHAYGTPSVIDDAARISQLLDDLVSSYESHREVPWENDLPGAFRSKMERGIVAFEIPIERLDGKFKLNQNKAQRDQHAALEGLSAEGGSPDLVSFWREILARQR